MEKVQWNSSGTMGKVQDTIDKSRSAVYHKIIADKSDSKVEARLKQ